MRRLIALTSFSSIIVFAGVLAADPTSEQKTFAPSPEAGQETGRKTSPKTSRDTAKTDPALVERQTYSSGQAESGIDDTRRT